MSKLTVTDDSTLPPVICSNLRPKVEAAQLPIEVLKCKHGEVLDRDKQLVFYRIELPPEPQSAHPLILSWEPDHFHIDLFEEPVEAKLSVWNRCARPIRLQYCGLWGDNARLGASWRCYPHTRFWLPPGLTATFFLYASPKATPPISSARAALQIAAAHLRDNVTGYFMVPIQARFLKYVQPSQGEEE